MDAFETNLREALEDFTNTEPVNTEAGIAAVHQTARAQDRRRQVLIAAVVALAVMSVALVRIGVGDESSTVITDAPEPVTTVVPEPEPEPESDAEAEPEPEDGAEAEPAPTPEAVEAATPAPAVDDRIMTREAEGEPDGIAERVGAQLDGGFTVVSDDASGASGDHFVESTASGDTLEFEFDVPESENYVFSARVTNRSDEPTTGVWVEASNKRTRWEPPTNEWQDRELVTAFLAEGSNTVRFEALGAGIAIDSIRLRPLAGPRPDIDNVRRGRLRALLKLYVLLGNETESFETQGGDQDSGDGAVYLTGADLDGYGPTSIADVLLASVEAITEEDQAAIDEVAAPLPSDFDKSEFVAIKCAGRVAVFTKSAGLAPTKVNSGWWVRNNCPMWPLLGEPAYFELSAPPGGFDRIRVATAETLIEGFERLRDATGTVVVGGGFQDRGTGTLYVTNAVNSEYSELSVADGLQQALDAAGIDFDVPLDHPPDLEIGDLVAARCEGTDGTRIGIFAPSNGIEPSAEHGEFWSTNGCTTSPIDNGRTYFLLTD